MKISATAGENQPVVIFPLMCSGDLLKSAIAAIGSPQFTTGPQKCYKKWKAMAAVNTVLAGIRTNFNPTLSNMF